ncbi:transmembrane protein 231 [Zophobas morio]|uniref:transmembrane protein 231 n=1 Tax=Zophobas morio TaxID=2755281 RepID=UPI0030839E61
MVILDVFVKNINITYKSTLFSKATLLTLIFGIMCVVLPFIFAYKSKGFWIKRNVFHEQPDVKFKGEYLFVSTTNNINSPVITCSTLPQYEQLDYIDACSMIKIREIDKNFDNKADEFSLILDVTVPTHTQLTSFFIIIPVDYKLSICPVHMQAAVIYQTYLPVPVSKFMVTSDVGITQSSPISCHTKQVNTFYNYSIITSIEQVHQYDVHNIITAYSKRNISTVMKNVYTSFKLENSQNFVLDITLRYPEDIVYYKPGFWETMKWAWMQYVIIYLTVSYIITKIKTYVFNRRLVLFYEDNPLKKKQ